MKTAVLFVFVCALTLQAQPGRYNELADWAKQDCADWRALVSQTNRARNGRDVAAAMRENVRRQEQTIAILLKFARSHRDLRDAAQLGLGEAAGKSWREHYPNRTALSSEVGAIQQQLTNCMDSVGAGAREQMVNVLRKYNRDKEVLSASLELHKMWDEHDRKLLEALR